MLDRIRFLFIVMALVSMVLLAQSPILTMINPDTVGIGAALDINLYGSGFITGITSDFGSGIIVTGTLRLSGINIRASVVVTGSTPLGPHDVVVTNPGGYTDTLVGGLFVVSESDPPTADLLWPACGETTACNDRAIEIAVDDVSGIDSMSIELLVGSTTYTIASPELTLEGDSLILWTPIGGFSEGLIHISLTDLADTVGNHIPSPPFDCSFLVDTTGPVYSDIMPSPGGTTRDFSPTIYVLVHDDLTDFDTLSLYFIVDGNTFSWGDAPVRFRNDTLFWYGSYAGVTFDLHEVVSVCIGGSDIVVPCGPNSSEFCWTFSIEIPPPLDMTISIESINPANFPFISAYCTVNDEDDRMIEGLHEDNFRVWTNGDEQYPLIVNSLGSGGAADIVWVIDTTGSMWGLIDEVAARCIDFAESLAVSGIDYRLGLVTFSDIVNFPHGLDLTGSSTTFQSWIAALSSAGGGDGPEVAFDAMIDALETMHFRPGARIVICMVSDAPYHYLGDGTSYSDETYADLFSAFLSYDAIAFVILDTSYTDSSRPYEGVYYGPGSITAETGGAFYEASTDFDTILTQIVENISGGYYVRWSTSHPVASCDMRHVEIEASLDEFHLDDDDAFDYLAPCSPLSAIIEPHPDTVSTHTFPISSRPFQKIICDFSEIELEDSVDESSIQLVVEGTMFTTADPELVYEAPYLTFTPTVPWTDDQMVDVVLARVMDTQGNLPWIGPLRWVWGADLEPPRVLEQIPLPDSHTENPYDAVGFKIKDDFSGLNDESLLFTYTNIAGRSVFPPDVRIFDIHSPGVTWDGENFSLDPSLAEPPIVNSFLDTICLSVIRAMDSPDYIDIDEGPNSMNPVEWCFAVVDDDTLCPVFEFAGPQSVVEGEDFNIWMIITDDQSGVYDPSGDVDSQGVYLIWDTDGELDIDFSGSVSMSRSVGDTFKTDLPIGGLIESADFVFAVYACDNDFDGGVAADRSCCWSDSFSIHVIRGPIPEILYPQPSEVSTNADQAIVMTIVDSVQGVDSTSIIFGVNGIDHTVGDGNLTFLDDTMVFVPPVDEYFTDGMWVACSLKQALDMTGDSAAPVYWQFFVDLTPPLTGTPDPPQGTVVLDLDHDITVPLWDALREVDPATIEMVLNETDTFSWGAPGISYDASGEMFRFRPEEEGIVWPNNDSICITLSASDIMPDYGNHNTMEPIHWCFFPSVT
ncbi:hypothetical protein J7L01_03195, partial [bacterium]|nr:hypothetical protein [bacterium]